MSEDAAGVNQTTLTQKKNENDEVEKKTNYKEQAYQTFPWLRKFDRSCCKAVGNRNIKVLESLLATFVKKVGRAAKLRNSDIIQESYRAEKLRTVVKDTVIFLNMLYQDLKLDGFADNKDYRNYLNLMTELMGMYLDLEIKASKTEVDSLKKIGLMMTTSLFVFLDQSEDHIIEAILKAKLITKDYGELCAPVLAKFLKDGKCFVANEESYIRYLLAFKLWKRISEKPLARKNITKMAERKLNPSPQLIDGIRKMTNILPSMPKKNQEMTEFLMNAEKDQFKFIPAKQEFLRTCSISCSSFPSLSEKPIAFSDCLPDSISAVSEKDFKGKRTKKSSFKENIWSSKSPSGTGAIGLSTDSQKPRVPQLSSNGIESGTNHDDDSDDIDFIECPKSDKPVVVITLDADGEPEMSPKESNQEKKKDSKTKIEFEKEKELKKEHKNICLKNKIKKRFKNLNLGKKIPNSKKSHKAKDDISTKEKVIAQSPEHGVVDSTSSNMGSPKYQVYEIHSNTGDDKFETASSFESNEACSSLLRRPSADSVKISSTHPNSVPFSSIDSSNNETNVRVLSSKEIRFSNSRSGPESDNTISNSLMADSSSRVTKALTFEEKTDAESNMSEKENLTYQTQSEELVKTSEFNLHSNLSSTGKQDSAYGRKNSVIQNWNGLTKSDQSQYSQVECKTLKVDKNDFQKLAKSLKIVKSKDLPEFNQVASGRSLLKSSYPSVNADIKKTNDVSSTNRLNVLPRYVKIPGKELNNWKNVRKTKAADNNQYYNGKKQHEIVDVVPEAVNEEFVCATTELEISSSGNNRNFENTEQKLPQRRNVKPVPIICKPISEEPVTRRNNNKKVQNKKSEMDPVKSKQKDAQRMPQLIDQNKIKPLNRQDQKSPSPPILEKADQMESEVNSFEPSILTNENPVSDFSNLESGRDGNPENCNQDNFQVQNRLCDQFNGSVNSDANSNFGMSNVGWGNSVGVRDFSFGETRKEDEKDPTEETYQTHLSSKDFIKEIEEFMENYPGKDDSLNCNDFSNFLYGDQDGVPEVNQSDDENLLKGNYVKYHRNYPDLISVPCQRIPECCCIRCSHKRKYFQILASRPDFFLQLRAARLKRLREADILKSQDDELLRRIEESFKPKRPKIEDLPTENKEKNNPLSNLPLKKRLKKLAEEDPNSFANIPSTSSEKFPSYPIKPMISIAEIASDKELSPNPPKIPEPVKPNVGTVLPVQRQEKKTNEVNPTVKNLPAFEKLVELHRSAYLAQVKGDKRSSSMDMMKSFMSPISMIPPEKNKSQIAQRYDYKISKPLKNEEKIPNGKTDNPKSTKDNKRKRSSESKSRKRKTETQSRKIQRKGKSTRKR